MLLRVSFLKKLFGNSSPAKASVPGDISPEFAEELEISRHYLQTFTELNTNGWGFGKHERYALSQDSSILRFDFADGRAVETPYQAIGSVNASVGTWGWAWAAPGLDERFTVDSLRVRMYGEENNIDALTIPEYPADLPWAWDMVAFAARACEANGAYAMNYGPLQLFVTFGEIRMIEPQA